MKPRQQGGARDASDRQQHPAGGSCQLRVGPWKMILPADRQLWNRGPVRHPAPDRGEQLALNFDHPRKDHHR